MKFPIQHKTFSESKNGGKPISHRAHRDGAKAWATTGDKNTIVMQKLFPTVAAAGKWMNKPSLNT
ncbi:MAG: hypothetical protein JRJ69_15685 [Deltaproteobacteria bacterium]|nr:hypothetical protein [Deltaproteobacteria bacterium]